MEYAFVTKWCCIYIPASCWILFIDLRVLADTLGSITYDFKSPGF